MLRGDFFMDTLQFVTCVLKNAVRIHGYKLGHDGSDGYSDCIGLIVGALALGGVGWPGIHGTNYTARFLTDGLCRDASLQMGDLVFKAREPGEAGYDLPDRYADSPDRLDYYHVGVVLRAEPLRIVHCTSGGVRMDDNRGNWRYSAWLRLIQRQQTYMATVTAESGSTVNLRSGPGLQYDLVARVPLGATVEVLGETNADWALVAYNGLEGSMMRKFLTPKLPERDDRYEQIILLRQQLDIIGQALQTAQKALEALAKQISA